MKKRMRHYGMSVLAIIVAMTCALYTIRAANPSPDVVIDTTGEFGDDPAGADPYDRDLMMKGSKAAQETVRPDSSAVLQGEVGPVPINDQNLTISSTQSARVATATDVVRDQANILVNVWGKYVGGGGGGGGGPNLWGAYWDRGDRRLLAWVNNLFLEEDDFLPKTHPNRTGTLFVMMIGAANESTYTVILSDTPGGGEAGLSANQCSLGKVGGIWIRMSVIYLSGKTVGDTELLADCTDAGVTDATAEATIFHANLGVIKTATGGGELAEASEESPGAYVAVNNDNDDYDFSGASEVIDSADTNGVTGENDMVSLVLHEIEPDGLGGKYKLSFTSTKIKIWKSANRTQAVSTLTEFDASQDTTVYVEGITKSTAVTDEKIEIRWYKTGVPTTFPSDRVNFTVYEVTGPRYVPGYSIYTYKGAMPGAGTGSWAVSGGTIKTGASANTSTILWNAGPVTGHARFTPATGWTCDRETYVVEVKIKSGATNSVTFRNPPSQNGVTAQILSVAVPPAMEGKLTVERISGPSVGGSMRGMRFIQLGFIQNGTFVQEHGDFDGFDPKQRRQSSLVDGIWHIDYLTTPRSTAPWANSNDTDEFLDVTSDASPITNRAFTTIDRPKITATDKFTLTVDANTDDVDRFGIEFDVRVYFAVRTTDDVNGSAAVYSQRAKTSWEFDGSGTVNAAKVWTQTGTGNTGIAASFADVTNGTAVPVTTGTPINDLFVTRTWDTIDQP